MLAALDLLAVTNLVNYFGRHDEVDKVQVSPVLLKKGNTKVALYGMGSMRDERLNRMWQAKKIRFLKPDTHSPEGDSDNGSGDEGTSDNGWFNIFALHQNRDLGRGGKNCVHESMIPEWMDLVVWGHEHECLVHPAESAVGTFRITQPGSSVATSLTEGESVRKHVGILDVRGSQFRVTPVPLLQVRSFAVGHISLKDCGIDPTDPRVDDLMAGALETEVNKLMEEAKSECRLIKLLKNLRGNDGSSGDLDTDLHKQLKFQVRKPEYVLVRLRVEHSGFTTLHNQRFGSRFMDKIVSRKSFLTLLCNHEEGSICCFANFIVEGQSR
jgi:double-strand break repair protein MRE11